MDIDKYLPCCATHNPFVLNWLVPNNIRLNCYNRNGELRFDTMQLVFTFKTDFLYLANVALLSHFA